MATKKTTTMIYKHLNFKNNSIGMSRLFKSLAHSLRIPPTVDNKILATKILEWDDERSHLNLVYCPSLGKSPIALDTLTEKQKVEIQEGFITDILVEQKTKDKKSKTSDTLSKYKAKINKWHNSITDDNNPLKILLLNFLDKKDLVDIESDIGALNQFEFARKSQKIETVKKFFELHNKVVEDKSDISRNKIFVQEAFFKIPTHNKVEVKTADLISNIHSFYKENFPDYPIKLIVFHGDEIGNHPHIFVDAKNKRTEKYDLLTAQKKFVNANIDKLKAEYPDATHLDFSNRSYSAKKTQAQYFQTLFYQHSNKMLAKYDVEAKKLEKTKENNARMRLIEEDAKKPKIERQFSFYNAETSRLNEAYNVAKSKALNANKEKEEAERQVLNERLSISKIQSHLSEANEKLSELSIMIEDHNKEEEKKKSEIILLEEDLKKLKQEEATHKESIKNFTHEYFIKIFDEMKSLYLQMLGLKPFFDRNLKKTRLGKVFLKNDALDENEFDNRVKGIVKYKSVASLELFNAIDRHYDKKDKDFEARTKKRTREEVKHRAANNKTSKNEWTENLDRSVPSSKVKNENSHKLKNT